MKRFLIAASLSLFAASALAHNCPVEMKKIDEAMAKGPKVNEGQLTMAKKYRQEGEMLHKQGKHTESMAALGKAKELLGVK